MKFRLVAALLSVMIILIACSERVPKRDHIPIIKQRLVSLQEAVKDQNRVSIDSLLSTSIFDFQQNSDSLLNYVYGVDNNFAFETFGNASIVYTTEQAQIRCYIMDSTRNLDRPFTLNYRFEHNLWLLSSFEMYKEPDSL